MSKDLRNTLIAGLVFLALAGVMVYFVTETQAKIDEFTGKNTELQTEIDGYQKDIDEGPKLQRQLKELTDNFAAYITILPSAEYLTPDRVVKDLIQKFIDDAKVEVPNVTLTDELGKGGRGTGDFVKVTITMRVNADFESFLRFLNLIERHKQFLMVQSFSVNPGAEKKGPPGKEVIPLAISLEISTFKYIPSKLK